MDIVENYRIDDSESDTSDPSDGPDQDRTPDPDDDDDDEQDHNEEQEPEDEVDEEEGSGRSHNGRDEEPHDLPYLEGCSTESDSSSVEEETGSEWGHEDSTNSECSDDRLKSVLKRRSEHEKIEVPINAHLGKYHTVRMAEDAKWYFVKDNRAVNAKEYKTKVIKHGNHDTMTRRRDKHWYVELNQEGFGPRIPPWKLARDRDIAIKRASWDFKATYPKRAPQCEKSV